MGDPAAIARGGAIFAAHCALCHGAAGDGQGVRHAGFKHPPPDFTTDTWRRQVTPAHVLEVVTGGVPGTTMGAWAGTLTEKQRADVTAFVLSLAGGGAEGPEAGS